MKNKDYVETSELLIFVAFSGMPSSKNPSERGCLYVNYEVIYPSEICTPLKLQLSRLIPDPNHYLDQQQLLSDKLPFEDQSPGLLETETSASDLRVTIENHDVEEATTNDEPEYSTQIETITEELEKAATFSPDEGS